MIPSYTPAQHLLTVTITHSGGSIVKHILVPALCLLLCAAVVADGHAETDIGFKGVGGRLSFVSPDNIDGTIGFGGVVDLGTFAPRVGFGATLDMWFSSQSVADFRDIIFGANSRYKFEVKNNPKLKPYAGGGLALHFFHSKIPAQTIGFITIPEVSDTSTKLGVDLFGGTAYEVSPKLDITGELMYRIVSDVGQFVISGGVIYYFGRGGAAAAE
jgi:opacity protein-like surface antigen